MLCNALHDVPVLFVVEVDGVAADVKEPQPV